MSAAGDPVLQAVVRAAVEATDADQGWIVAAGGGLRVVAAVGSRAGELIGTTVSGQDEGIGWVIASGQSMSMAPSLDQSGPSAGVTHVLGRRISALLCVPCTADDEVVGALALLDKVGGDAFPMSEVELATLLGDIAGVALAQGAGTRELPSPNELGAGLADVARDDPERYAALASTVATLLGRG